VEKNQKRNIPGKDTAPKGLPLPSELRTTRIRASCGCLIDWWTWCRNAPGSALKAQAGGPITCPTHGPATIQEVQHPN